MTELQIFVYFVVLLAPSPMEVPLKNGKQLRKKTNCDAVFSA